MVSDPNQAVKPQMVDGEPVRYDLLPELHRASFERYIEHRIPTGSGLRAILEGDLYGVCMHCDDDTKAITFDVVRWLYNRAPGECFGSPEKVRAWLSGEDLA